MALSQWMKNFLLSIGNSALNDTANQKLRHKQSGFLVEQRYLADRLKQFIGDFLSEWEKIGQIIRDTNISPGKKQQIVSQRQRQLNQSLMQAQKSLQSTAKLQQEKTEWERRLAESCEPDLGHPAVRVAMLESELKIRDMLAGNLPKSTPEPKPNYHKVVTQPQPDKPASQTTQKSAGVVYVGLDESGHLNIPTRGLIRQIKDISKEIALHHNSPYGDPHEMLDFAHELKNTHALLKKEDRKSGRSRDRIALTDGFIHIFSSH